MSQSGFQRVVQMFWSLDAVCLDDTNPVVVLGKQYAVTRPTAPTPPETDPSAPSRLQRLFGKPEEAPALAWPAEFVANVHTRMWFTYRTGFPAIPRSPDGPSPLQLGTLLRYHVEINTSGFTSDAGWGCMIRTLQSVLANALVQLRLGRDYVYAGPEPAHNEIVDWFRDLPSAAFLIHNMVATGARAVGIKPGEWFGPNAASRSIKALCDGFDAGLRVLVSDTGDVYELEVVAQDGLVPPTLLLFLVRLGIDNVSPHYHRSLQQSLAMPQLVGIAGGRPQLLHYFFGYQGSLLFYLDPHLPQPAGDGEYESYHTARVRVLPLAEVDPLMLVAVLVVDRADWDDWKLRVEESALFHVGDVPPSPGLDRQPLFSLVRSDGDEHDDFVDLGEVGEVPPGADEPEYSMVAEPVPEEAALVDYPPQSQEYTTFQAVEAAPGGTATVQPVLDGEAAPAAGEAAAADTDLRSTEPHGTEPHEVVTTPPAEASPVPSAVADSATSEATRGAAELCS